MLASLLNCLSGRRQRSTLEKLVKQFSGLAFSGSWRFEGRGRVASLTKPAFEPFFLQVLLALFASAVCLLRLPFLFCYCCQLLHFVTSFSLSALYHLSFLGSLRETYNVIVALCCVPELCTKSFSYGLKSHRKFQMFSNA